MGFAAPLHTASPCWNGHPGRDCRLSEHGSSHCLKQQCRGALSWISRANCGAARRASGQQFVSSLLLGLDKMLKMLNLFTMSILKFPAKIGENQQGAQDAQGAHVNRATGATTSRVVGPGKFLIRFSLEAVRKSVRLCVPRTTLSFGARPVMKGDFRFDSPWGAGHWLQTLVQFGNPQSVHQSETTKQAGANRISSIFSFDSP